MKEIIAVKVVEVSPGEFVFRFYNGLELPIPITPEAREVVTFTAEHFAALAVRGTWEKLRAINLIPEDPSKDDSILPIVALKMIEKNRFSIRFFGGEELIVIWALEEANKEISYEKAAAICRSLLTDGFKKMAFDLKEKGGEWPNPKTPKPDTTN
jgi:hypothetical protein